jgi:hypothetical protein
VTLNAAVNAMGWAIAPYLIFKAKNHNVSWFPDLKPQWRFGVINNGWTTNEIGVAWLKHFIEQIKGRRVGSHVLFIIDGHESHKSLTFQALCEGNKIITLCMPPHSSHILQPLDVGCFAPPKAGVQQRDQSLGNRPHWPNRQKGLCCLFCEGL